MTKRLMSDRDHLEALVHAIENLESNKYISSHEELELAGELGQALLRVIRTSSRARQDLYPED